MNPPQYFGLHCVVSQDVFWCWTGFTFGTFCFPTLKFVHFEPVPRVEQQLPGATTTKPQKMWEVQIALSTISDGMTDCDTDIDEIDNCRFGNGPASLPLFKRVVTSDDTPAKMFFVDKHKKWHGSDVFRALTIVGEPKAVLMNELTSGTQVLYWSNTRTEPLVDCTKYELLESVLEEKRAHWKKRRSIKK